MGIEDLNLAKGWVGNQHACGGFANEPIPSYYINRRAIQRIWMYRGGNNRKPREDDKSRSKCTTITESTRCLLLT